MSTQERVVIVTGSRTPFVRERKEYHKITPASLGGIVLRDTLSRSGIDPRLVEEVYFGIVSPPAEGSNVSREALFDAGLDPHIPCTTVNRYCASAAEAAGAIAAKIQAGQISIGLAGGVESISSIRALFSNEATDFFQDIAKAKTAGQRFSLLSKFKPAMLAPMAPGIKEPTTGLTMGQSADLMAREFKITREEQDRYAVDSHLKAHNAWEQGFFRSHIANVPTPDGKVIDRDTIVRADTSMEKLTGLRPVFYKDGTITAGNASPLTDGAASVLLMSESRAKELGLQPIGAIRSVVATAVNIQKEPLLIGPAFGFPKALKMAGISWEKLDLLEIHEAFAGQVLSTIRAIESAEWCKTKLGLASPIGKVDHSKLNVHGGSIAIGHPFGATGARMILQAIHGLRAKKKNLGLISICAAGGMGQVMVVEAI